MEINNQFNYYSCMMKNDEIARNDSGLSEGVS